MSSDSIPSPGKVITGKDEDLPSWQNFLNPGGATVNKGIKSIYGGGNATDSTGKFFDDPVGQFTGAIGDTGSSIGEQLQQPDSPTLEAPDSKSKTPDRKQASTSIFQNQLMSEKHAFLTSTYLTGGAGLLEEPTTTSRVLLGA